MKKMLPILLCIMILFNTNINVNAQQNNNEFYETIVDNIIGYTSNDSNLPSSGNYYFGLTSDGFVYYVPANKVIPIILTKGIGVVLKPEVLVDFISDYLEFGIVNSAYKPVYNGSTKIGRAFDDITGKTLLGSNNTTNYPITVPNDETNNVYEYYNDWKTENGYDLPDYINLETRNKEFYLNKLDNSLSTVSAHRNYLNSNDYTIALMKYIPSSLTYYINSRSWNAVLDESVGIANNVNYFKDYCNAMLLDSNNIDVPFTSQMLSTTSLSTKIYETDNLVTALTCQAITFYSNGTYTQQNSGNNLGIGSKDYLLCCEIPYFTVYKDMTVFNQFVNKTYAPISFNTQQYYDYSTSDDNSISTNSSEVDNSVTNNETIYNSSAESFSEYYEENNYHIDNSVTINNTTEIVNNYYGDDDNGGDDNGGGSGGGSDDSDGSLLDRLLNAILDFFKGIAKIITAILTGIFELFNSILEAIANITTSFEGITNLFSAIFGWLPDPIINLMVLGLGLALLAAFITWFR